VRTAPILLLALFAGQAHASPGTAVPGQPVERHVIHDRLGREIVYYAGHPATPAPILLMIQGSGCAPVMQVSGASSYSTLFDFLPFAGEGRFTVIAVEKPFAGHAAGGQPGTANGCSPEFNTDFTAERWLVALRAALADARGLPSVDPRRTLLFGHSEGAVMADLLAGSDPGVTDVISIGGAGSTQLFDLLALPYQTCFDRTACIADVERQARAIAANPQSATDFAWGHPYRRWTSFFSIDPAAALLRSRARIYLAFGTADRSVPAVSAELIVARLLSAGRDVTVRRVADADHSLLPPGAADFSATDAEYRRALDWFWSVPPPR
jgi:pimeloyl-ACP methyl ester carboxylesterase